MAAGELLIVFTIKFKLNEFFSFKIALIRSERMTESCVSEKFKRAPAVPRITLPDTR